MTTSTRLVQRPGSNRARDDAARPSRGPRRQCPHPNQVICGGGERHVPIGELAATMPQLPETADGFHPSEYFLNELAPLLTRRIAGVPRRPAIDRALLHLARDVWRDALRTHRGYETRDIKALVRADRRRPRRFSQQ